MIKKYKRKSDFVEAVQWTGENKEEVETFVGEECIVSPTKTLSFSLPKWSLIPFLVKGGS